MERRLYPQKYDLSLLLIPENALENIAVTD